MDLSKTIAVTAVVLVCVLAAGHALAQATPEAEPETPERKLSPAAAAADLELSRRQEAADARRHAGEERALLERQANEDISRRCQIKPVMTDAEIDACKLAYRGG
jgi:hypothetical protein